MATVTGRYKVTVSYDSVFHAHQPPDGNTNDLYYELKLKLYAKANTDPFYFGSGTLSSVNYTYDSNQNPNSVSYTVPEGLYAKRILDIAKQVTY